MGRLSMTDRASLAYAADRVADRGLLRCLEVETRDRQLSAFERALDRRRGALRPDGVT